jgi:hypothetical protein
VLLGFPAKPENVRLARLTAAAIGSRMGFGLEQLDDVRMAVDELCYCLMGDSGVPAELSLTFYPVPDGIGVEGTLPNAAGASLPRELPVLSKRIFDALTSTYECQLDGADRWFRLTKRVVP